MRFRSLLLCGAVAASSLGLIAATPDTVEPMHVLVGFHGDALPADLDTRLATLGVQQAIAFETINTVAITAPEAAVMALTDDADIRGWRTERRIQLELANSVPFIGAAQADLVLPEDYTELGPGGTVVTGTREPVDGTGVTVAVIDSGVTDLHPDLARRVLAHRNFELTHAADFLLTSEQLDLYAEATGVWAQLDDIGHGTHVAGTIAGDGQMSAGRENRNKGVAPGAQIIDLRIADAVPGGTGIATGFDVGWERNAVAVFDWLLRHHDDPEWGPDGIQITSNSWGIIDDLIYGTPEFDPLDQIVRETVDQGIHTVFSAGNDGVGDDVTADSSPEGIPGVIAVAAGCHPGSTESGCRPDAPLEQIGSFSSRGAAVDITAPGVDIVAAAAPYSIVGALGHTCPPPPAPGLCLYGADYSSSDGQAGAAQNFVWYAGVSGTSMAAPHISGVVALMVDLHPTISTEEVRIILAHTADDILDEGRDIHSGWGYVNVREALIATQRLADGETLDDITLGVAYPHVLDDETAAKQRNAE